MSRPLRLHVPNMPYHVMSRGNAKQCIFEDEQDHVRFLELLAESLERFATACLSYCLLWNHFHLVLVPGLHPISRVMQHLNSRYCSAFNRRHKRIGHVLGGRFKSPLIDNDSYLLAALRYIARNPIVSGHVARPEEWRWSSYRALSGIEPCPPFLSLDRVWRAFDCESEAMGRERFVTFVAAADFDDAWIDLDRALYVGGQALGRRLDPLLEPHRKNVDFTYAQRFATRPPLAEIIDPSADRCALQKAAWIAFSRHAYLLREIGEIVDRPVATVWDWINRARRADASDAVRSSDRELGHHPPAPRGQISIFE